MKKSFIANFGELFSIKQNKYASLTLENNANKI